MKEKTNMALTTSAQQILRNSRLDRSQFPEQYWELIDRYRDGLIEQALSILHSQEDAEDAVQETFCEVFRNSEKLSKADSVGAWLHSVNRGNALKRLRTRRRADHKTKKKQQEIPEETFTTGGFSALELRESVNQALQVLPPDLREVVKLRYFQNLSFKEIADRLKIDISAVQRRLLQASNQLYGKLKTHLAQEENNAVQDTDPDAGEPRPGSQT